MHLHGMWSELENGHGEYRPFKHTILVKPAEQLSFLVTADARALGLSLPPALPHGIGHVPGGARHMSTLRTLLCTAGLLGFAIVGECPDHADRPVQPSLPGRSNMVSPSWTARSSPISAGPDRGPLWPAGSRTRLSLVRRRLDRHRLRQILGQDRRHRAKAARSKTASTSFSIRARSRPISICRPGCAAISIRAATATGRPSACKGLAPCSSRSS